MAYPKFNAGKASFLSRNTHGYNDDPNAALDEREDHQRLEYSRLVWQADQAKSRGLITTEEAEDAKSHDHSSFVQRMLGLTGPDAHNSGSTLESIGDVLGLPNYAMAGLTAANLDAKDYVELESAKDGPFQAVTNAVGNVAAVAGAGMGAAVESLTGHDHPALQSLTPVGNAVSTVQAVAAGVGATAKYIQTYGYQDFGPQSLRIGFSPSAFASAWTNKTDFVKLSQAHGVFSDKEGWDFAGGLAADVLLDPTTYLSFGVSAGAKVGLTDAAKVAAQGSRVATLQEGHLTKFGTELYRLAEKKLLPTMRKDLEAEAAREGVRRTGMSGPAAARWHETIANHVVENFDQLKKDYLQEATKGWWNRAAPGSAGNQASAVRLAERLKSIAGAKERSLLGFGVDDIFQETASALGKDRGYSSPLAQRILAGKEAIVKERDVKLLGRQLFHLPEFAIPKSKVMEWAFDTFDKGWDAPAEVAEHMRLTRVVQQDLFDFHRSRYALEFGKLTLDQRSAVSKLVEAQGQLKKWGEATLGSVQQQTPEVSKAVEFFNKEMEAILSDEKVQGFAINDVQGYVAHFASPQLREMYDAVLRKNGEEILAKGGNRFAHQRMIASIAEGEELFGKGAFETDAYRILTSRRRASIDLIEKDKLFKFIATNYSKPQAIVHAASRGMSKGLLRGFARRAGHGVAEVLHIDQVYAATHGNLRRLGFIDPGDGGKLARHRDVIKYLTRPNDDVVRTVGTHGVTALSGKYSAEGVAESTRLNLPEAARLHFVEKGSALVRTAVPVEASFPWHPLDLVGFDTRQGVGGGGKTSNKVTWTKGEPLSEFHVDTALAMLDDPTHVGWRGLFPSTVTGETGAALNRVYGFLGGLHNWTVRHLDSQLPGMVPDIEERVWAAWRQHLQSVEPARATARTAKTPRGQAALTAKFEKEQVRLQDGLAKVLAKFSAPLEVRKVMSQLPPELVEAAAATRRLAGIYTSDVPPSKHVAGQLERLYAELGFTPELRKQLNLATFGREDIRTAQEADHVFLTLAPYTQKVSKSEVAEGRGVFGALNKDGDDMVALTFRFGRKVEGNYLPSVHDQNLAIPAAEGAAAAGSTEAQRAESVRTKALAQGQVPPQEMRVVDKGPGHVGDDVVPTHSSRAPGRVEQPYPNQPGNIRSLTASIPSMRERVGNLRAEAEAILPGGKGPLRRAMIDTSAARKAAIDAHKLVPKTDKAGRKASLAAVKQARADFATAKAAWDAAKPKFKDLKIIDKAHKEAQKGLKNVLVELKGARAEAESAAAAASKDAKGGGVGDTRLNPKTGKKQYRFPSGLASGIDQTETPADRLLRLRQRLATAGPNDDVAAIQRELAQAREGQLGQAANDVAPEGLQGQLRPNTKPVEAKVYVPKSVAKLVADLEAPDLPVGISKSTRTAIQVFDAVQGFYRNSMLSTSGGFYSRNAQWNVTINLLEHGLRFLRNPADTLAPIMHALATHSDYASLLGGHRAGKIGQWGEEMGKHVLTAANGETITARELVDEARTHGLLRGLAASEHLNDLGGWTRLRSGLAGAVPGLGVGTVVGAATGAAASASGGEDHRLQGVSWGAALGAIGGGLLGVRGVAKVADDAWFGGIPVRGANAVTGLLHSQWRPVIRAGETATELPFKLSMFAQEFLKSGNTAEAARKTLHYMNDYNALSVFERRWMRRMVPFYAWTKHALGLTASQLIEEPGKISGVHKLFRDWNVSYEGDPEDVQDYLHDKFTMIQRSTDEANQRDAAVGRDAQGHLLPPRRTDAPYAVLQAGVTPYEDSASLLAGILPGGGGFDQERQEFLQGIVSKGAFAGVSLFEGVSGQDTFTGKPIKDAYNKPDQWAQAPEWLQGLVGYQPGKLGTDGVARSEASVNPNIAWLLGEAPGASQFIRLAQQVYNAPDSDKPGLNTYALSRQFLGVSAYRIDPQTQRVFLNQARIDKLKNVLDNVVLRSLPDYPGNAGGAGSSSPFTKKGKSYPRFKR